MSMWRSWSKSSPNLPTPSSSTSTSTSNSSDDNLPDKRQVFRCSSFKDIENLCISPHQLDNNNCNHFNDNIINNNNVHLGTMKRQPSSPRRSIFHRVRNASALLRHLAPPPRSDPSSPPKDTALPSDTRIVVYYTTLRVIRPTFEACRAVQSILQGFRVAIDERDLAMDSGFMTELRELLGTDNDLTLPRVFIAGRYIGGADEVKQLHEVGELKSLISGLPLAKPGTCPTCGGYRFILCTHCSGSHKVFSDKSSEFRTCNDCNENGLVKCPDCSSPPPTRPVLAPINNAP